MHLISKRTFLRHFALRGIALDTRYNPPQTLVFEADPDLGCTLDMPGQIKDLPRWITTLVDAARADRQTYLYPREGAWQSGGTLKLFQMAVIFAAYGLKPTGDEVVVAEDAQQDAVETLLFVSMVHGGTVSDDIFLVPDHGKAILYADHHEAVHAQFEDRETMDRFLGAFPEIA